MNGITESGNDSERAGAVGAFHFMVIITLVRRRL